MSDLRTPLWLLASVLGAILTASACGGGSSQTLPAIAPTTAAPAPTTTVVAVPTTEAVSADTVPALLTLGAEITLSSAGAERSIPLDGFYTDYKKSAMRAGELLTSVSWNVPPDNSANLFYKLGRRKGDAITVTGVAVMIAVQDGLCCSARIALGSVGPTVFRAHAAEDLLTGKALDDDLIEQAARTAVDQCSPINDIRASAGYRLQTAFSLTRRLLIQAWKQLA